MTVCQSCGQKYEAIPYELVLSQEPSKRAIYWRCKSCGHYQRDSGDKVEIVWPMGKVTYGEERKNG